MASPRRRITADLVAVVKRSRGVAKQLNQGVTHLMKKNKIAVHMGSGVLTAKGGLTVTAEDGRKTELAAKNIIVATGARARDLPFAPADGKRIWTYRHAMTPPEMPTKLLVIGSGAIGIEFASFYNDMGAQVTVVEMLDRVVPVEDADISAHLEKALRKQGMTILTSTGVEKLEVGAAGVKAAIKGKDGTVTEGAFSHVIVAIGIVPNTEGIGPRGAGREDRARAHRHRRRVQDERGRPLRDRRRDGAALAGAQGQPRRRDRRPRRSPAGIRTRWIRATSRAAPTAARRSPASG